MRLRVRRRSGRRFSFGSPNVDEGLNLLIKFSQSLQNLVLALIQFVDSLLVRTGFHPTDPPALLSYDLRQYRTESWMIRTLGESLDLPLAPWVSASHQPTFGTVTEVPVS